MLSLSASLNPTKTSDFDNLTIANKKKMLVEAIKVIPTWFKEMPFEGTMNRLVKLPLELSEISKPELLLPSTWAYLQLVCILFPDESEKLTHIIDQFIRDRTRTDVENRSYYGCTYSCFECDVKYFRYLYNQN